MPENNYVTREDFEQYKKDVDARFNDTNNKTTDVLVKLTEVSTKFDGLDLKVNSIDKKLEEIFAKGRNNVNTVLMSCLTGTLGIIIAYVFSSIWGK